MDRRILKKIGRKTIRDKIKALEVEISTTKYNKRTQHHIGLVKAKIRKLKEKQATRSAKKSVHDKYAVKKTGNATVILVGFPSVGKSTLLNAITDAKSKIADYEFTTLSVIPGLLNYNHAKIQVLDVPGIVQGAADGTGRGKEVLSVMRNADLVVFLIDINYPKHLNILKKEVYDAHLRVNQIKPDITISKKEKGGLDIGFTVKQKYITKQTVAGILKEFRINNAQVVIRGKITPDDMIDGIEKNKIYIPGITVLNKIDTVSQERITKVKKKLKADICISADKKTNLKELKELIFQRLNLIRLYCKEVGKPADLDEPIIMKKGTTIEDFCAKLHRDFINKFRFARLWGSSKFPGQEFKKLGRELKDGDIVEIHLL